MNTRRGVKLKSEACQRNVKSDLTNDDAQRGSRRTTIKRFNSVYKWRLIHLSFLRNTHQ